MDMLNSSFGSGGMTCALDQNVLPYFIQNMKRQAGEVPTKKAVVRPGKQEDGMYFLNKDVCIDADGKLVDEVQDKYVWLKKELVCEGDKILVADIVPNRFATIFSCASGSCQSSSALPPYPSPPCYCRICYVLPL